MFLALLGGFIGNFSYTMPFITGNYSTDIGRAMLGSVLLVAGVIGYMVIKDRLTNKGDKQD